MKAEPVDAGNCKKGMSGEGVVHTYRFVLDLSGGEGGEPGEAERRRGGEEPKKW